VLVLVLVLVLVPVPVPVLMLVLELVQSRLPAQAQARAQVPAQVRAPPVEQPRRLQNCRPRRKRRGARNTLRPTDCTPRVSPADEKNPRSHLD
jgi:hypothetical protein